MTIILLSDKMQRTEFQFNMKLESGGYSRRTGVGIQGGKVESMQQMHKIL
jgi:hypothetical protein